MIPAYLQVVYAVTDRAKGFGHRVLPNGTALLGHVSHYAPEAWLHQLFAPLSEAELTAWEQVLGLALPPALRTFYTHHNGLNLFSCELALHGRRHSYERSGDAAWQPFDLTQLNPYRFAGPERGRVYVAGDSDDRIGVDLHTHSLFRSTAAGVVVQQWSGFEEMLVAETHRLAEQFDERGRALPVNG